MSTETNYHETLPGGWVLQHTQPVHARQLEELQKIVFPTLAEDQLIKAIHYLHHLKVFPEGQLVITDQQQVIGMTTTMRTRFDFDNPYHTFKETIAGGWLSRHDPHGDWLYGLDMGILPAWRGQGLARALYRARHTVAERLKLRGQLAVGMLSGYGALNNRISGQRYYDELIGGKRKDPTLTAQMNIGFEPLALIPEYLNDPLCGNFGVLIKIDIDKKI
jgi:GNAT superfamily N-acetyltransferase